jgi:hypothetical protein
LGKQRFRFNFTLSYQIWNLHIATSNLKSYAAASLYGASGIWGDF